MIKNEGRGRWLPRVTRPDGDRGLVAIKSPVFFVGICLSIFILARPEAFCDSGSMFVTGMRLAVNCTLYCKCLLFRGQASSA